MLNQEMIELIIFKQKHHVKLSDKIQIGEKALHEAHSVKNVDVYFYTSMSTESALFYFWAGNLYPQKACNISLEIPALASSHGQITAQDPDLYV